MALMYHECSSTRHRELLKKLFECIESNSALDLNRGGPLLCGRLLAAVAKIYMLANRTVIVEPHTTFGNIFQSKQHIISIVIAT